MGFGLSCASCIPGSRSVLTAAAFAAAAAAAHPGHFLQLMPVARSSRMTVQPSALVTMCRLVWNLASEVGAGPPRLVARVQHLDPDSGCMWWRLWMPRSSAAEHEQ